MYAELQCKTNFSFLKGASHPEELVDRAHAIGLKALAITDINGVYGLPKAYNRARSIPGFKLIAGAEILMADNSTLSFLATNRRSYATLCRLLTRAHADKEKGEAHLQLEELEEFYFHEGFKDLVCFAQKESPLKKLKRLFPKNLYIPLTRYRDGQDLRRVQAILDVCSQHNVPYVATNDVLYHEPQRRPLQDCLTSIQVGVPLNEAGFHLRSNAERYLKSPFEMKRLFTDLPEAIDNSAFIADSCTFSMSELRYRYPSEWVPNNHSAQSYLTQLCFEGAKERYNKNIPDAVHKQMRHELELIEQLNYADYFLTIYDIAAFARQKDILCQGRGSAANSVVCYVLGVTSIDPIQMNFLFERFISVERNEPPDIDVDFEHERREEVIQYIYERYGRDRAGMVSAVVTYQKRSAFRELCKAFGIPVGTLSSKKIMNDFEQLSKESFDPQCAQKMEALSEQMNQFPRHISIHSGGFTLSADPIIDIVPIEPARMEGRTIIQWDKYDLDYLGLLKIDVLALGMLTALKRTMDLTGHKLYEIPQDDKETYKMIQKADTVGTFQVESRAQMNMSGRLLPKNFYDLIIQIAIVRPGPIVGNMVHPYLRRRRGLERPDYPHPALKTILQKTLGVPLFQEQLMKIAVAFGKFSPGEADLFRRAISAWRSSGDIRKVAEKLYNGMIAEGIPPTYAETFIAQMKGFGHYGFPESHSASFANLSYASCYLKRHHPAEFLCGLLNSQPMGFYSSHSLIDDAKNHGVKVLPIHPNLSVWECTMEGKNTVRLGWNKVRGISRKHADTVVANKPYASMSDFLSKTDLPADVLLGLSMGDTFKVFGEDQRHSLWTILDKKVRHDIQLDMFSGKSMDNQQSLFQELSDWQAVQSDYSAFGLSTRTHPMVPLRKMKILNTLTTFEAKRTKPKTFVRSAGLILVRQKPPTANGTCFSAIEDEHGFLDMVLFPKMYEKHKKVFLNHCFLIVGGFIERDGHTVTLKVTEMEPIFDVSHDESLMIEPTQYFW